jgi:hypothetical protein
MQYSTLINYFEGVRGMRVIKTSSLNSRCPKTIHLCKRSFSAKRRGISGRKSSARVWNTARSFFDVESLKLSVILSQSCSEKHTTCQTPDPFSSDSESGGDLPRFFRRFSSFLLWRFSFAFFFWNGIKLLLLRVLLHEFGIILTLSTPISAATWQETMLNQLWCRMAPARSFSVYFGMFHLLTKFRTISKAVLSYTVGLQGFSIKTSVFHLWYSCTEYKEAPDGIQ